MSSTTSSFNIVPFEKNLVGVRHRSHPFLHDTCCVPRLTSTHENWNSATHLHSIRRNRPRRAIKAANKPPPPSPIPSGSSSSGWSSWMLLTMIPLLFSFSKSKWGPLLVLKQQLDKTIATVDVIADEIEEIAEKVDKMADHISEKLPEGSSLRNAIDGIGDLAEKTDKAAECVDDLLEQIEDAGHKLEKPSEESAKEKAKGPSSKEAEVK